ISFSEAALGAEVEVPTLYGSARLRVPKGIQSGGLVRMKGQGFPVMGRNAKGDQIVQVVVQTPTKLSRKEEKLFRELSGLESTNKDRVGSAMRAIADWMRPLRERLPFRRPPAPFGQGEPGGE
ncbi:MAG: DnaJ C-terminal domain-containing protein, partial [bacterium]